VLADAGQIELVLINLAVNARDAMPDGGSLTIRTSGVPPANRAPGIEALGDVRVTVADTGTGMEEEVAARAFDAFFTTKNPGKGVGLGLPTVYRIIEEAGGAVRIHSIVGEGTVVELDLPATDQAPEAADAGPLAESLDGRGETILLVEDEEGVRRVAERILTEHGYEVLTAADGAEALTVLRGRRESLDLLLADVVLPKVSGPEVARELRTNSRGPAVLYMSGYPGEALGRFNPDDETLLRKPFKAEELLCAVRTSLERAGRVG
jgi:CheY-like chemotaxis protein